jgi:tetratricopeptide (TPR) repeat protein
MNRLLKVAFVFLVSALLASPTFAATEGSWRQLYKAAETARDAGQLPVSEDLYRQALAACEKSSDSAQEKSKCLNALAAVLCLENKTEEAETLYKRSLGILEAANGSSSPVLVQTMLDLGSIYEAEGNHPQAMVLYKRVLGIDQVAFGPYHLETGKTLHKIAKSSHNAGKLTDAEPYYKKAMSIFEKQADNNNPNIADLVALLQDYSRLLSQTSRKSEAKDMESKAAALKDQLHKPASSAQAASGAAGNQSQSAWQVQVLTKGSGSGLAQTNEDREVAGRATESTTDANKLAPVLSTLADVYFQQQRYSTAESLYKTILAIDEKTLGADHPGVAFDLLNLAQLYVSEQRYQEAEPILKRALAIYESNYGSDNLLLVRTKGLLGSVYEHEGKTEQAQALYKTALDAGQKSLGPNNLETAKILNNMAYLCYRQEKYEDAETYYKWALASTEGAVGPGDPLVAACLQDYAKVLRKLDRVAEAENMEDQAKTILSGKQI